MNFLFLRTPLGRMYTLKIAKALRKKGHRALIYRCTSLDLFFRDHRHFNSENLLIHARAASPHANWMTQLTQLSEAGYRVINSPQVLKLTSDKFDCNKFLIELGNNTIARTFVRYKGKSLKDSDIENIRTDEVVIKPRYSQGGGVHVRKIPRDRLVDSNYLDEVSRDYSCSSVVQEYINYRGIYRVFVINGHALPVLTFDSPTENRWKVSVCLNQRQIPITRNFNDEQRQVMSYAEEIQNSISGDINFIDVFVTDDGPKLSEINTACSLLTHERKTNFPIHEEIANYLIERSK